MRGFGERGAFRTVMWGERRTSGHEADSAGNQSNAHPAQRADLLVQGEAGNQREQNVSQGGRGQNVRQIGPGKRVRIRSEEGEQQDNPARDPGIAHGQNDALQMVERDAAGLLHAVRKHGVASRRKDADSSQNQILSEGQGFNVSGCDAVWLPMASSRAEPLFRRREGSRSNYGYAAREIPPPAGANAGVRDDTRGSRFTIRSQGLKLSGPCRLSP